MPVQFRDYYETLGVPKTASEDDIRSAFRKLARKYHPDVAKDKKAAEEKFKEINVAVDFTNGAAMAVAGLSSSSAGPDSAISSKHFLAADAVVPHSAGSADALPQPNAARMWKRTLWSHWRKRCTAPRGPCHCGAPVQIRWNSIRSKFPAVSGKASGSVCVARAKPARVEERVATFFFGYDWPSIRIFQSKAAI